MIEQEAEGKHRHQGRIDNTLLIITLQSTQSASKLSIDLRNEYTYERYRLVIDQVYLRSNNNLNYLFASCEDLYYSLVHFFNELRVASDGTIQFEVRFNLPRCKSKIISLATQKLEMDEIGLLRMQLDDFKKNICFQLQEKEQTIKQLQQEIGRLKQERLDMEDLKKQTELLKVNAIELRESNSNQMAEIGQLRDSLKEKDIQFSEIVEMKQTISELKQIAPSLCFTPRFDNPHKSSFHVRKEIKKVVITKIKDDNKWVNFISNCEISEGRITIFTIRQLRTKTKGIMMGVGTSSVFGISAYEHKQSLAYNSWNGYVYENGEDHKGGPCVCDDEVVQVHVDLIAFKVVWILEESKAAETVIPEQMRNKRLFLVLQFLHKDSQLEILFEEHDLQ